MTDETVILTSNGNNDSTERYYSEMESARNVSMDAYFGARPQLLKTHAEQALYRAGFERAFQHLWNKAHGSETPEQRCGWFGEGRGQCLLSAGHEAHLQTRHHTCEQDGRLLDVALTGLAAVREAERRSEKAGAGE